MLRLFVMTLALLATLVTAKADEKKYFFEETIGKWSFQGIMPFENKNAHCGAEIGWEDGVKWTIWKDIGDGEVYFIITNPEWKFLDPTSVELSAKLHYFNRAGKATGVGSIYLYTLGKSTVRAGKVDITKFVKTLADNPTFIIEMPGSSSNLRFSNISVDIINTGMGKCWNAYKKAVDEPSPATPLSPRKGDRQI